MAVDVVGVVALLTFYVGILIVGLLAYWFKGRRQATEERDAEKIMVARRDIGWLVGSFTMTATWCGGGYINGTAEMLFTKGFIFAQTTIGNSISLIVAGLFFAGPMRERKYVTMLDPFAERYGDRVCALMYLPAFISEVFWVGCIMAALGASITVVMKVNFSIAVCISVVFCVLYVVIGGIYSVTWTDMAELSFVFFGLILSVPFVWCHEHVHLFHARVNGSNFSEEAGDTQWLGTLEPKFIVWYIDTFLLCILGGVPWQDYFQRVLVAKSAFKARMLSFVGSMGTLMVALPATMIGIASRYADWDAVGYSNAEAEQHAFMILPLSLQYLTPKAVAFFGVGAVSAAVMSSADASLLSISAMFMQNFYTRLFRPKATERERVWVLRLAMVGGGVLAAVLAIFIESVTALWIFACDMVYVLLFPQLVCVLFVRDMDKWGATAGYLVGAVLRFIAGETELGIPVAVEYPMFDRETGTQLFPVKTFAMLVNLLVSLGVSRAVIAWKKRRHIRRITIAGNEMQAWKEPADHRETYRPTEKH